MGLPPADYLAVASLLSGFGIAVLMFRLERELHVEESDVWLTRLAWADYLVIGAISVALLVVVLPLLLVPHPEHNIWKAVAASGCAAAAVLLLAYPWAILDHYRLLPGTKTRWGKKHQGELKPRDNPEPGERWIVPAAIGLAVLIFVGILSSRIFL